MAASKLLDISDVMSLQLHDPRLSRHSLAKRMMALSFARRNVADEFGLLEECGFFELFSAEIEVVAGSRDLILPADFVGCRQIEWVRNPIAQGGDGEKREKLSVIKKPRAHYARQSFPTGFQGGGLTAELNQGAAQSKFIVHPKDPTGSRWFVVRYTHGFPDLLPPAPDPSDDTGVHPTFDEILVLEASIWCVRADQENPIEWEGKLADLKARKTNAIQGSEDRFETEQVEMVHLGELEQPQGWWE